MSLRLEAAAACARADHPYSAFEGEQNQRSSWKPWEIVLSIVTFGAYALLRSCCMKTATDEPKVVVVANQTLQSDAAAVISKDAKTAKPTTGAKGAQEKQSTTLNEEERAFFIKLAFDSVMNTGLEGSDTLERRMAYLKHLPDAYKRELQAKGIDIDALRTCSDRLTADEAMIQYTKKVKGWSTGKDMAANELYFTSNLTMQWALQRAEVWAEVSCEMNEQTFLEVSNSFGSSARENLPDVTCIRERYEDLCLLRERFFPEGQVPKYPWEDILNAVAHRGTNPEQVQAYLEMLVVYRELELMIPNLESKFNKAIDQWEESHPEQVFSREHQEELRDAIISTKPETLEEIEEKIEILDFTGTAPARRR